MGGRHTDWEEGNGFFSFQFGIDGKSEATRNESLKCRWEKSPHLTFLKQLEVTDPGIHRFSFAEKWLGLCGLTLCSRAGSTVESLRFRNSRV